MSIGLKFKGIIALLVVFIFLIETPVVSAAGAGSAVKHNESEISAIKNKTKHRADSSLVLSTDSGKPAAAQSNEKDDKIPESFSIPVLMYHDINPDPKKCGVATVTPEKLRKDLLALKNNDYTPVFFKDVAEAMAGKTELPEKPVLITFDDGYYSNYQYAYPLLKEFKMKATISIIGWSVGRQFQMDGKTPILRHFTWTEAKEMYDSGVVDIQHHSNNLHNQTKQATGAAPMKGETPEAYKKRFREDTLKLKQEIEKQIGNEVILYTYPYGVNNDMAEAELKKMGFQFSVTVNSGISDMSAGKWLLKRTNVPNTLSTEELIERLEADVKAESK